MEDPLESFRRAYKSFAKRRVPHEDAEDMAAEAIEAQLRGRQSKPEQVRQHIWNRYQSNLRSTPLVIPIEGVEFRQAEERLRHLQTESAERTWLREHDRRIVQDAVNKLPERERGYVEENILGETTIIELAKREGISSAAIRYHLNKAKIILRKSLREELKENNS